jgi:hypothetical protein
VHCAERLFTQVEFLEDDIRRFGQRVAELPPLAAELARLDGIPGINRRVAAGG